MLGSKVQVACLSLACKVVVMVEVEVREVSVGLLWALALPALHSAAVHSVATSESSSKLSWWAASALLSGMCILQGKSTTVG